MSNVKKMATKVIVSLLAVVMVGASLGFATSMLATDNRDVSMNANVQTVADSSSASTEISPRHVINGDGGFGTRDDPYYENDWNGRIETDNIVGSAPGWNYHIDINVDPRNTIFVDDIIIEYRFYIAHHFTGNTGNEPLALFYAYIEYYNASGNRVATDSVSKSDRAVGGFTKNSGSTKIAGVRVRIDLVDEEIADTSIYYRFGKAPSFI